MIGPYGGDGYSGLSTEYFAGLTSFYPIADNYYPSHFTDNKTGSKRLRVQERRLALSSQRSRFEPQLYNFLTT